MLRALTVSASRNIGKRRRKRQESYDEARLGTLNVRPKSLDLAA